MKKLLLIIVVFAAMALQSCSNTDFRENYADPSKVSTSTIEKQFSGLLYTNREYVLPAYWNYFVVMRTTLTHYTQAVGWINSSNQYVPGEAGISARWDNYYDFLVQYRELEKIYESLSPVEQAEYKIYMLTAAIYFYDHTQRVVDLHGDIPFSAAGRLSQNGGDYINSLPSYDSATSIYTTMLDELGEIANDLNGISVSPAIEIGFATQDFVNGGDLTAWKKYCNSLRLRMLTRVSGASEFQSRSQSEISAILANPGQYPIVEGNSENIQIDVTNLDTPINSKGFRTGLEDWDGNLASKAMIDHMNTNSDPRLRAMFEQGENAAGVYIGLDPLLLDSEQTTLFNTGTLSIYNRSSLSRNEYFPGILMTATEVSLLKAEAYLKSGNDAMAKTSYEDAISKSTEFYYALRNLSADGTSGDLLPTNDTEIMTYVNSSEVNWNNAATEDDKISLIATQKWIHFSVLQLPDSWAEIRRLNKPEFDFLPDNANAQTLPPNRWLYPSSEKVYNTENYGTVSGSDNLTTKIFWDVD